MNTIVERITKCRFCQKSDLQTFLELGSMPKPNALLSDPNQKEDRFPLAVCRCINCHLIQLTHMIDPKAMFAHYLYSSAMSQTILDHFSTAADKFARLCIDQQPLVIDIGSNDGSFLRYFKNKGFRVLGVDPALNIAERANKEGITTHADFFSAQSARQIKELYGQADIIVGTNVFAHIDDLADVLGGIDICLKQNGSLIMEFPYFVDLVENNEFDTIYHEHRYYFLIKPLQWLLNKHGFEIFDAQHFSIHGGTLRLYIQRSSGMREIQPIVAQLIAQEEIKGMYNQNTYDNFAQRVYCIRDELINTLKSLKTQGKKIIGYGASAKGNVLLNFCSIGPEIIDFVVDNTPYKQGLFTPGMHIPIMPESHIADSSIDYALLLIWNFKDEVLAKQGAFRKRGGKFILPIPSVEII